MNLILKCIGYLITGLFVVFLVMGCVGEAAEGETAVSDPNPPTSLKLPRLAPAELNGGPLKVVATTSIIGDVVAQVGGEHIQLTTLMGPGQDPHSYEPGARQLTAVANAHVIFINGWDLEEALVGDLDEIGANVPLVAISAGIPPLRLNEDAPDHEGEHPEEELHYAGADPHVWLSVSNAKQWVENAAIVLSDLDPAHSQAYAGNAAAYQVELDALAAYARTQLAQIPEAKRFLVTNHDSLGYFAQDYNFTVLGTVFPGQSTLAEPSASDLVSLIEVMEQHDLCTIFTDTTSGNALGLAVADELDGCESVQITPLFTGSTGPSGSGAESYIGMFRANVDAIVEGLTR